MFTNNEHLRNDCFPPDWEITHLGEIGNFTKGGNISKNMLSSKGFPCVLYGEIYTKYHFLAKELSSRIPKEYIKNAKQIKYGDILFAGSGETAEEIGKCFTYIGESSAYAGGDLIIFTPYEDNSVFLAYLLNSLPVNKQKEKLGQGHSVVHIYSKHLESIKIPLPPIPEQIAIAEVLSDVDALIEAQEALIEKKCLIKQGVMQELLTGQKRLPGFDDEWQHVTLKDIGTTYGGLTGKSKSDFENGNSAYIPFLNILENPIINTNQFDYVNVGPLEPQNKALYGDLFFNGSSETPEEVGMCSVLLDNISDLYLNSFCFGFRLFDNVTYYPLFLSHLFRSEVGRDLMFSLAQGATRYNLSKTKFLELVINVPDYKEQQSIAMIISDIDLEINNLEKKVEKIKKIKQGMMQELLTGRTRLV